MVVAPRHAPHSQAPYGAYRASTAWAIAFMPLAADSPAGMERVSSGSYTTLRGSTFGSRPVRFTPSPVRPHMGVISKPAYVVGTATIGRPVRSATAFARPITEPPPTAAQPSALVLRAAFSAS